LDLTKRMLVDPELPDVQIISGGGYSTSNVLYRNFKDFYPNTHLWNTACMQENAKASFPTIL